MTIEQGMDDIAAELHKIFTILTIPTDRIKPQQNHRRTEVDPAGQTTKHFQWDQQTYSTESSGSDPNVIPRRPNQQRPNVMGTDEDVETWAHGGNFPARARG